MYDDGPNDDETNDEECMSPVSPIGRRRNRSFMSSSDDSLASTVTDVSLLYRLYIASKACSAV